MSPRETMNLEEDHYAFVYICIIVFVFLIAALAIFCTIRRLFYGSWRPWAPITDRICCCGSKLNIKTRKEAKIENTDTTRNYYIKELSYANTEPKICDCWEIQRESLEIGEKKLGAGAYAVVYEAVLKGYPPAVDATQATPLLKMFSKVRNEVAVKMPPLYASLEDREEFLREITFMKQLGFHPHLLTLLGCSSEKTFPFIVLELCDKGDLLAELLRMNLGKGELLAVKDLPHIAWQISDALIYLDSLNIIHRDIAARNVLLKSNRFAKLGDFGLCRLSQDQYYVARGGRVPVKWTAPEALERNEFSTKSDIWSFGIFLFEVFSLGHQPYASMQPEEILPFLREGRRSDRPVEASERIFRRKMGRGIDWKHFQNDLRRWKMMCWCWEMDPAARPSPQEIHKLLYEEIESSYATYGYMDFQSHYHELAVNECGD